MDIEKKIRFKIEDKIYSIRQSQVMLDNDLADLYQVEIKVLNQAVKRNIERFPENFRFQLTNEEYETTLRSQNVTLKKNRGQHRKYLPYAFTEQGVAMLSGVLRSEIAINVSIQIMNAFVSMRKIISNLEGFSQRIERLEKQNILINDNFEKIFKSLETNSIPNQGIFFDGQIFDAYLIVNKIIKSAQNSIILIDNYVDESILNILTQKNDNVNVIILSHKIDNKLILDVEKANSQYPEIKLLKFNLSHDRFIIIDEKEVYHIGASLKDLGKKWFAFTKLENSTINILEKIKQFLTNS